MNINNNSNHHHHHYNNNCNLGEIYHAIFKPLHFVTFWVPDPKTDFTNQLGMQCLVIRIFFLPNCFHVQADDQFNSNGVQTRPTVTFSHVQADDQFNSNGVQTRPTLTFSHVQADNQFNFNGVQTRPTLTFSHAHAKQS